MSKEEVLGEFETDLTDPGSEDGEYLFEHVLRRTTGLLAKDREGVVEVCRYWLSLRGLPHTLLAVAIARDFIISELKPDLEKLRGDIQAGRAFKRYYIKWVDEALAAIG